MKRHLFFAVLAVLVVIFSCTSLYAGQGHLGHFYVGAGGSYAFEDFDKRPDYDNSWGVNAKIGYHTHPLLDIEFDIDHLNKFENNADDLEIQTYMIVLKGYFHHSTEKVKFSTIVGTGRMHSDETGWCAKVGLGLDFFTTQNISLGIEGNYTFGFDDLEEIEYLNFTIGAAYHF
ncbi:MAG: porin family protein [Deltaproteobacteria bacterium]|nr:porin family protein [Deltaproteobacteria bacterium]MDL1986180.1 porin family protein [Deltaproteobacteria bacterium]